MIWFAESCPPPYVGGCIGLFGERPRHFVLEHLARGWVQLKWRARFLTPFLRPGLQLVFDVSVGFVWHLVQIVRRKTAQYSLSKTRCAQFLRSDPGICSGAN